MDQPLWIAGPVVANGGCARRIGYRAIRANNVQRGVVEWQAQVSKRNDARVDQQLERVLQMTFALEEAKRIARTECDLAHPKRAAVAAHELAAPLQTLVWPDRHAAAEPHAVGVDERALAGASRGERGGQVLPDFDPR